MKFPLDFRNFVTQTTFGNGNMIWLRKAKRRGLNRFPNHQKINLSSVMNLAKNINPALMIGLEQN